VLYCRIMKKGYLYFYHRLVIKMMRDSGFNDSQTHKLILIIEMLYFTKRITKHLKIYERLLNEISEKNLFEKF
jgi:tRNA/tmRNA/rRNA uracil-C5-methylase (TrmA/RlmC/RlmD family)